MGIRFAKSIKLGDLVKINFSKSGVSASIGKKGASVNIGSKGTYLNLSPTIAGITGTGVSYRQKITGGYGSLLGKLTGKSSDSKKDKNEKDSNNNDSTKVLDLSVIEEYENNLNASINVHKLADKVINASAFDKKIEDETNDSIKEIYSLSKQGDEDTIESLVGSFMTNFDFAYPVKANYELEDDVLYIDLDLPEIEELLQEYPTVVKESIVNKKKTQAEIKLEYAYTVMSLSAYISAQMFNLSPTINQVVISGFTSKRNKDGDMTDEYLYSIRYLRNEFETTDLSSIDNIYDFILKFENRINFNSSTNTFKGIRPFEMPSIEKANSYIDDAIFGLKELGYKNAKVNEILPKLNEMKLNSSSEYLKEALKLLSSQGE